VATFYLGDLDAADGTRRQVEALKRILPGKRGEFLFGTGCVLFGHSKVYVDRVFSTKSCDMEDRRAVQCLYTMGHERIHFLQWISTTFLFDYIEKLIRIVNVFTKNQSVVLADAEAMSRLRTLWRNAFGALSQSCDGITALDILEYHAVAEGMGMAFGYQSEDFFSKFIAVYVMPDSPGYLKVHERCQQALGRPLPFSLTSSLCYLALNSEAPAVHLMRFVEALRQRGVCSNATVGDLCAVVDVDAEALEKPLPERHPSVLSSDVYRRFLSVYFGKLDALPPGAQRLDFLARPGHSLGASWDAVQGELLPPLAIYLDDRVSLLGALKGGMWIDARNLIGMSYAMSFAIDNLTV
jgi:hypothetical protein